LPKRTQKNVYCVFTQIHTKWTNRNLNLFLEFLEEWIIKKIDARSVIVLNENSGIVDI